VTTAKEDVHATIKSQKQVIAAGGHSTATALLPASFVSLNQQSFRSEDTEKIRVKNYDILIYFTKMDN
jgi:hypothetical protein